MIALRSKKRDSPKSSTCSVTILITLYTAMLDAWALGAAFSYASSVPEALAIYNQDAVPRARALYDRSRRAGRAFAPDRRHSVSPVDVLDYLTGSSETIDSVEAR